MAKIEWTVINEEGNHYTVETDGARIEYCGPKGWVLTTAKEKSQWTSLPVAKRAYRNSLKPKRCVAYVMSKTSMVIGEPRHGSLLLANYVHPECGRPAKGKSVTGPLCGIHLRAEIANGGQTWELT